MCKFSTIIDSLSEQNSFHKIDNGVYSFNDWVMMGDFDDVITNLMKAKTLWSRRWTESITFAWGTLYGNFRVPCLQLCDYIIGDYRFMWHLSLLEKYGCQRGVINKMSALRNKKRMLSNEQENNKLLRNLPIQEILQWKEELKQAGANKGESMLMRPQSLFSLSVAHVKTLVT